MPSEAIDIIARAAAPAAGHRRIVRVDNDRFGQSWQPSAEHLDRPLWPIAQSAADVLTSGRLDQVRECALETCGWLFLDASRNRSRRWCDMKICGNRAKARRFYERTRAAA